MSWVMSGNISFNTDVQSYAEQFNILISRTTSLSVPQLHYLQDSDRLVDWSVENMNPNMTIQNVITCSVSQIFHFNLVLYDQK